MPFCLGGFRANQVGFGQKEDVFMKNFLRIHLTRGEWALWLTSLAVVTIAFLISGAALVRLVFSILPTEILER